MTDATGRLQRIERILWALTLVTLPVTSFRYMPFMGADSQVRPLALIPAGLLFGVLVLRSLRQRRLLVWSNSLLPLLAFAFVALVSSAVGFFMAPVALYQYTYGSRVLRAWITLCVGVLFFIVAMSMNHSEDELKFSLKWLYVGLVGHVAWSLVQLLHFYVLDVLFNNQFWGNLVDQIQRSFMVTGLTNNRRISGLALEPSWLAAQVLTVYLPWAFASVIAGYRWSKYRWLAPLCLVVCGGLILFTYSRSGILIAAGAGLLALLFVGRDWLKQAWAWLLRPFTGKADGTAPRPLEAAARVALVVILLAGLAGGAVVLSHNQYFARIWHSNKTDLVSYFVDIYAGPRLADAWAGWTIFEQHPWTGVGLGATGLYYFKALPDWAHFNMPEIAQLLSPGNQTYPNAKDLFIRLVAETGIAGLWTFMAFYLLMLGKALLLLNSPRKVLLFAGAASLMGWLAMIALGFTQDSLAMANIWLPLGMLAGMAEAKDQ